MPRVLKTLIAAEEVTALWWGPGGLIAGDLAGRVYFWRADNSPDGGLCHLSEGIPRSIHKMAVLAVCGIGPLIVSCSLDGSLFAWDGADAARPLALEIEDAVRLFPLVSENIVLIGTTSGRMLFYSLAGETVVNSLDIFATPVLKFARHPTADQLFVLTTTELALVSTGGECLKKLRITAGCCTCCAVAGDGYSCAVSTTEGTARIVDVVTFTEVGSILFDQTELSTIASYDYGKHFVVTGVDGRIGVFDLRKMVKEQGLKVGKKPLIALSVNEAIGKACVAGCDAAITILDFD